MDRPPTVRVEFDRDLLDRLRQRHPGKSDRELLESIARSTLGSEALRRVQRLNALSESQAIALGVEAVHDARHHGRSAQADASGERFGRVQ